MPVRADAQAAAEVVIDPLTRARFGLALVPVQRRLVQQRLRAPAWVVADPARRRAFPSPVDLEVAAVHLPGAAGGVSAGEPMLTLRLPPGASAQDLRRLGACIGLGADAPADAPRVLRAPGPGLVPGPLPAVGARLRAGEALLEHVDLAEVLVELELHADDLPLAVPGSVAFFEAAAPPRHHGRKRAPADRFRGTLHAHPAALDPRTRHGRAMARVENPDGLLVPGAALEAELDVVWGSVVVVPDSAVISTGARDLVFLAGPGDALRPVEVDVGRRGDGLVETQSGLKPGDEVVGLGAFFVAAESRLRTPVRLRGADGPGDGAGDGPRPAPGARPRASGGARGRRRADPADRRVLRPPGGVGPSLFGTLLILTVAFAPIFLLDGPEGRLFRPLALTKAEAGPRGGARARQGGAGGDGHRPGAAVDDRGDGGAAPPRRVAAGPGPRGSCARSWMGRSTYRACRTCSGCRSRRDRTW